MIIILLFEIALVLGRTCKIDTYDLDSDYNYIEHTIKVNDIICNDNGCNRILNISIILESKKYGNKYIYDVDNYVDKTYDVTIKTPNEGHICLGTDEHGLYCIDCGDGVCLKPTKDIWNGYECSGKKKLEYFIEGECYYDPATSIPPCDVHHHYTGFEIIKKEYKAAVEKPIGYRISFQNVDTTKADSVDVYSEKVESFRGIVQDDMIITNYEQYFGVICEEDKTNCIANPYPQQPMGLSLNPNELTVKLSSSMYDPTKLEECNLIHDLVRNCDCDEICDTTISVDNYPCNFEDYVILCDSTTKKISIPRRCNISDSFGFDDSSSTNILLIVGIVGLLILIIIVGITILIIIVIIVVIILNVRKIINVRKINQLLFLKMFLKIMYG